MPPKATPVARVVGSAPPSVTATPETAPKTWAEGLKKFGPYLMLLFFILYLVVSFLFFKYVYGAPGYHANTYVTAFIVFMLVGVSLLFFTLIGFAMMGYVEDITSSTDNNKELSWWGIVSKYSWWVFLVLVIISVVWLAIYSVGWMQKNNYFNLFMFFLFLFVFVAVVVRFIDKIREGVLYVYNNKKLADFIRLVPMASQEIYKEVLIHHPKKLYAAIFFVTLVLSIVLYYFLWYLWKVQYLWGGGQLVRNKTLTLNMHSTIGTYLELNPFPMKTTTKQECDNTVNPPKCVTINHTAPNPEHNYRYAISFWFFLDQNAPDLRLASSKWCPIFNYGNKPLVVYRADTNTLMVVYSRNHEILHLDDSDNGPAVGLDGEGFLDTREKLALNKDLIAEQAVKVGGEVADAGGIQEYRRAEEVVEDGNAKSIVYRTHKVPLQKWNNMVINYDSGIMDIFLNGRLVQSMPRQITFMSYDTMEVGSNGGVRGRICNVVYFPHAISRRKVGTLYESMKWVEPPYFGTWQPNP